MNTDTKVALDELVADLFALDRRAEAIEDLSEYACSGECTDDGCSRPSVQFQAAIAQVRTGDLDAAAQFTQEAFTVVPGHRDARIDTTAKRLYQQLCGPAARTSPLAVGIRDQVEDLLSVTPARLELS